ncbi:MAG: SPOR domain-containing protein [Panacagrimonas sp.]
MGRDYVARNRRPAPKPAGLPGWVWLVAGLSMGLVVAAVVYIGRPTEPMPMAPAAGAAKLTPQAAKPKVEIPPKEDPRFDFYTLLEKEQVVVPAQTAPAQATQKPPPREAEPAAPSANAAAAVGTSTGDQYLIVAGAFREPGNADEHRARLALAGIESNIERIQGQDNSTWHRVRIGPEPSLARAQSVLSKLQSNGFEGRVVKLP